MIGFMHASTACTTTRHDTTRHDTTRVGRLALTFTHTMHPHSQFHPVNLTKHAGPLITEDKPWDVAWWNTYPSVAWSPEKNVFQLWYNSNLGCSTGREFEYIASVACFYLPPSVHIAWRGPCHLCDCHIQSCDVHPSV
jgi:hypothetical protein